MKPERILEVCTDSVSGALMAQATGTQRIEFCNNLTEGGTTPLAAQIEAARKSLHIPLYVFTRKGGRRSSFIPHNSSFIIILLSLRKH
jgi:copper homeostasis protein